MHFIGSVIALAVIVLVTIAVAMARRPKKLEIPDTPENAQERQVLEALTKSGDSLSLPRTVNFYLYFPTPTAAEQAACELQANGFGIEVSPAAEGPTWLCFATKTLVPSLKNAVTFREYLSEVAGRYGGEYDGWESPVRRG